ncbi:MAG: hypothetical protein PHQ04_03205 [Opitutaceae bacterium]|nr:hypothetical protein [Opitutaceae bacterium]
MKTTSGLPKSLTLPIGLIDLLIGTAEIIAEDRRRAFRLAKRTHRGSTVRPGMETPLWNGLAAEIRPYLRKRGTQANLARLLGLDRQAVHAYFTARRRMPDAERTLQLVAWLIAVRKGQAPA